MFFGRVIRREVLKNIMMTGNIIGRRGRADTDNMLNGLRMWDEEISLINMKSYTSGQGT